MYGKGESPLGVYINLLKSCSLRPLHSKAQCMHFLFKKCLWSVLFAFPSLWFLGGGHSSNCFFWNNSSKQCLFLENTFLKVQQKESVVVQLWPGAISPFGFSAKNLSYDYQYRQQDCRFRFSLFLVATAPTVLALIQRPRDLTPSQATSGMKIILTSLVSACYSPSKNDRTLPISQVFRVALSINQ